ncbi:hypothetical protein QR680_018340 [Steinernema hermaphroditum]|uniref:Uncharacterized protein n=1 Tax=Steinernema hermaphroditum TaxID=289476 RepID=A0AA39HIK6_9BILA|nr:hypothetical protein QR680_018340 [Steinernema hermaphroditum]
MTGKGKASVIYPAGKTTKKKHIHSEGKQRFEVASKFVDSKQSRFNSYSNPETRFPHLRRSRAAERRHHTLTVHPNKHKPSPVSVEMNAAREEDTRQEGHLALRGRIVRVEGIEIAGTKTRPSRFRAKGTKTKRTNLLVTARKLLSYPPLVSSLRTSKDIEAKGNLRKNTPQKCETHGHSIVTPSSQKFAHNLAVQNGSHSLKITAAHQTSPKPFIQSKQNLTSRPQLHKLTAAQTTTTTKLFWNSFQPTMINQGELR